MYGDKKLMAWQLADRLGQEKYPAAKAFRSSEMLGLTSQLQRAALLNECGKLLWKLYVSQK